MTETQSACIEQLFGFHTLDFLVHTEFELGDSGLCQRPPRIVSKIKETILVNVRFRDMKIGPDQRYQ